MLWFLPLVLSAAIVTGPGSPPSTSRHAVSTASLRDAALLTAPDRRVRTVSPRIQSLLAEGMKRSTTFARLISAVNQTDVIVYLQPVVDMPKSLAGRLLLLPLAGGQRYLRVQLRADLTPDETIALIGHELRHALEVADARDVRDEASLIELYQRIGNTGGGSHSYDTVAAQTTGRVVRSELAG